MARPIVFKVNGLLPKNYNKVRDLVKISKLANQPVFSPCYLKAFLKHASLNLSLVAFELGVTFRNATTKVGLKIHTTENVIVSFDEL